jgi:hypothetical protein
MTDAPACGYDHVYVTVNKIRVHQSASADGAAAGWSELSIPVQRNDLLSLNNGVLQDLGSLPVGTYQQVRLVLASIRTTRRQATRWPMPWCCQAPPTRSL